MILARLTRSRHLPPRDSETQRVTAPPAQFVEHMVAFHEAMGTAYADWGAGVNRRVAGRLAELADVQPAEKALDVGCGTGLVTRRLGARRSEGGLATGVDVATRLVGLARRDNPHDAAFGVMAAEDLGFKRRSFDAVTIGQTLAYLADPDRGLAEAHRVLRRGGRLAVSCRRRSLSTRAQGLFFTRLADLAGRHPFKIPRPPQDRAIFGEPRVLTAMLKEADFVDISTTQLVIGQRTDDAHAWTELMMGAGPFPHAVLSVLGPRLRSEFETQLDEAMRELGEGAFHFHHAFTFAVARRL